MSVKPNEKNVGFMIHLIHESLGRLLDEKLSVMAFLRARKGQPVSITEIKEELGVSAPTALGLVRRLEKKQYVSVYTDKRDQRVRLVVYNNQHLEPVEKSFVNASSVEEQMMSGFTSEEREQFIEYLNRAYQNIR